MDEKKVSDKTPPESMFGFIYLITYANGQKYCGKKQIWSKTKKPLGKRKLAEMTDKRSSKFKVTIKESAWRKYNGSSKKTNGLEIISKEILETCNDKINLTYCEQKWLMRLDVLTSVTYLNDCIGGKFYDGKIKKGK